MRTLQLVALTVLVAGCSPEYLTPRDACSSTVAGQGTVDDDAAVDAMLRMNCYRRFVGLPKVPVDNSLARAAASHAAYLSINYTPEFEPPFTEEDDSHEGYLGDDPKDRADARGYETPGESVVYFELNFGKLTSDMPSYGVVDWSIHDPVSRAVLLQPSILAAGYGEAGDWATFETVYSWPPTARISRPIVYPATGQVDVPTSLIASRDLPDQSSPTIIAGRSYGYPITVTVGSSDDEVQLNTPDPWGLAVSDVLLRSANGGEVDVTVITPGSSPSNVESTVIIWPLVELEPNTEHRVTGTLDWTDGPRDFESTFTTAAE